MILQKSLFLLFIFLITLSSQSQTKKEALCEILSKQLDTVYDLDERLRICKLMDYKVDIACRVNLYIEQGNIYDAKQEIDSSRYYINKAIELGETDQKAEEILIWAYSNKASMFFDNNKDKEGLILLDKTRKKLDKYPNSEHWVSYYRTLQIFSSKKLNYEMAIKYGDSIIKSAVRSNDSIEIPNAYHNKGVYYVKLGDYERAAENLIKAIELKERIKDLSDIAATYYVLGKSYMTWERLSVANNYFKKGIAKAKEYNDDYILMISYLRLAKSRRLLEDYEESIKTIDSGLSLARKLEIKSSLAEGYMEKGTIYLEKFKSYDKAETLIVKAYETAKSSNDNLIIYSTIESLIALKSFNKRYDEVGMLLRELEEVTEKIKTKDHILRLHKGYSEYFENIDKPEKALYHYKRFKSIEDSVSSQEIKTKIADIEKKYDTKTKELNIVKLIKEKEKQQQIAKQAKAQQNLYLVAAGFLLFLLVVGTWAFRKLRKQQKELASTNQIKNRLFSIIAHDLRGMIIPFQRSGKILKHHIGKGNHEKTIELSHALEQNSESLSNMLDNLLNWSLEQMNGYKMNLENLSIKEELDNIIKGYEQQAAYKKTKIVLDYQNDFNIKFDRGAFHIIFRNLIGNALKYTEEGTIIIKYVSEDDMFLCSVIDTGVGMSQDQLENLFTLEEKKSTIGTQGEKGTGLGLNLVYRFLKIHKGTIQVSSEKRIGTRFDLSMPVTISLTKEGGAISKPLSA
ncbi:ATP-binding protein [uncultured Aquimarina sp.]|uniref:ATP-binding protein n=1 Tax=uncultured Aquimarina sp. TaxID=575652 RepID=UPI002616D8A5|nr:ATP-binding protein [uncultured Aquimarina sp.]